MKRSMITLWILLVFVSGAYSQTRVCFAHWMDGKEIVSGTLPQVSGDFTLENVRYYVSGITLKKDGKSVFSESYSYHLIDLNDPATLCVDLKTPAGLVYDSFSFTLGIDSITNSMGVMPGDLDPAKGMYWAWQSGFINVKLEGTCSKCKSPTREFGFHLGGYRYPYGCWKQVELRTSVKKELNIVADLSVFFSTPGLWEPCQIMSPSQKAVELSGVAASMFKLP